MLKKLEEIKDARALAKKLGCHLPDVVSFMDVWGRYFKDLARGLTALSYIFGGPLEAVQFLAAVRSARRQCKCTIEQEALGIALQNALLPRDQNGFPSEGEK